MHKNESNPGDLPIYLFKQGRNARAYEYFGSHRTEEGAVFRVWAPAAKAVSVAGDFNHWNEDANCMTAVADGIWEAYIPGVKQYDAYKYLSLIHI